MVEATYHSLPGGAAANGDPDDHHGAENGEHSTLLFKGGSLQAFTLHRRLSAGLRKKYTTAYTGFPLSVHGEASLTSCISNCKHLHASASTQHIQYLTVHI